MINFVIKFINSYEIHYVYNEYIVAIRIRTINTD